MTHAVYGWMLAAALAVIGVWREVSGYQTRRRLEARLDALENGATYREMQRFCEHATATVRATRDEMTALRREMDVMAAQLHDARAKLSRALLECAQAEERVARLLNAGIR